MNNKLTITVYFVETDETPNRLKAVTVTAAERWPLTELEQQLATEQLQQLF